jgi:hypothetical protein
MIEFCEENITPIKNSLIHRYNGVVYYIKAKFLLRLKFNLEIDTTNTLGERKKILKEKVFYKFFGKESN